MQRLGEAGTLYSITPISSSPSNKPKEYEEGLAL